MEGKSITKTWKTKKYIDEEKEMTEEQKEESKWRKANTTKYKFWEEYFYKINS